MGRDDKRSGPSLEAEKQPVMGDAREIAFPTEGRAQEFENSPVALGGRDRKRGVPWCRGFTLS